MSESSTPTPPTDGRPASKTNPQCKVCTSPDRFEIEVTLARGHSQESVATRFSRNGQAFSRQNIHTHYHKHMQVIDLAVAEEAGRRGLSPMLDIKNAREIHAEHERNRARLRAQVDAMIEAGLPWKTRDVLAFMEQDVRIEEQRNATRADALVGQARAFGQAVREVVAPDLFPRVVEAYDRIMGFEDATESDVFLGQPDELDEGDPQA